MEPQIIKALIIGFIIIVIFKAFILPLLLLVKEILATILETVCLGFSLINQFLQWGISKFNKPVHPTEINQ